MINLTLVAIVHTSIIAAGGDTYADAHRVTMKTGKPLVVMVSTDWCAPCQVMKKRVLPQIRKRKFFKQVTFAVVNPDHDAKLARRLTGGGPVPQLIMFRKGGNGWNRRKLVGGQSVGGVEKFICAGLTVERNEYPASKPKGDST